MDGVRFYVFFNIISVISGRCEGDNERLCETELRLRLKNFRLRESNAGPLDQQASVWGSYIVPANIWGIMKFMLKSSRFAVLARFPIYNNLCNF